MTLNYPTMKITVSNSRSIFQSSRPTAQTKRSISPVYFDELADYLATDKGIFTSPIEQRIICIHCFEASKEL
jgi:hypothetical protein